MRDSIQKQAKQQAGFLTKHPDPVPYLLSDHSDCVSLVRLQVFCEYRVSSQRIKSPGSWKDNGVRKLFLFKLSFVGESLGQLREKEEIVFDIICDLEGMI